MKRVRFLKQSYVDAHIVEAGDELVVPDDFRLAPPAVLVSEDAAPEAPPAAAMRPGMFAPLEMHAPEEIIAQPTTVTLPDGEVLTWDAAQRMYVTVKAEEPAAPPSPEG
jgi:hypothetical protein